MTEYDIVAEEKNAKPIQGLAVNPKRDQEILEKLVENSASDELKERFLRHLAGQGIGYLTDLLAMVYIADNFYTNPRIAYEAAKQDQADKDMVLELLMFRFDDLTDCWIKSYDAIKRIKQEAAQTE